MSVEERIARKICDDVAKVYEALASETEYKDIFMSEEFGRIRKEIHKLKKNLGDEEIMTLILKKYSDLLRSA